MPSPLFDITDTLTRVSDLRDLNQKCIGESADLRAQSWTLRAHAIDNKQRSRQAKSDVIETVARFDE